MGHDLSVDIVLFAEFAPEIGTGHIVETLDLATEVLAAGLALVVIVPSTSLSALLERAGVTVETLPTFEPDTLASTARALVRRGARLGVTNFRRVTGAQVSALSAAGLRLVCIDEAGGRELTCAAVVNPLPVRQSHAYTSGVPGFDVYGGPAYLALAPEYGRLHARPRCFEGPIRSVAVSMGGVDRTGATLKIAEALVGWRSDVECHIVMGAAFQWKRKLERFMAGVGQRWRLHRRPSSLAEILSTVDVGISAGGNTLCELACVGTPALVLYEDEHEAEQGRALEAQGFGMCLGAGVAVAPAAIRKALDRLEDPAVRRAQSEAGRRLVDGRGASRICRLLVEQLSIDSAVST